MPATLRICLLLIGTLFATSVFAQQPGSLEPTPVAGQLILPTDVGTGGHTTPQPPLPGSGPMLLSTTNTCAVDTIQYPLFGSTSIGGWALNTGSPEYAQFFDAPDDLQITGATFFGWSPPPFFAATQPITVTVYEALPDSTPGAVLGTTSAIVSGAFGGGTLDELTRNFNFATPISITAGQDYIVGVRNDQPATSYAIVNNADGDGGGEQLGLIFFAGFGWFKLNSPFVVGSPDRDVLIHPHVVFDQTADFTFLDTCVANVPHTETFVNQSSPMIFNRMYNVNAAVNDINQSFEWNTGVSTGVNSVDHTETFSTFDTYTVSLTDTVIGWTRTCTVTEEKILYNTPTTDSITGPDTACVGEVAQFFAFGSNNANTYSWSVPNGWTILSGQNTSTLTVQVGTASGDVCAAAVNGPCVGEQACQSITALSVPLAPPISGPSQVCPDDVVNYFSAIATTIDSVVWSVSPNWELLTDSTANNAIVATDTLDGFLTLQAFNRCGASPVSTYNITVFELPDTVFPVQGPTGACNGEFVTFFTQSVANVTNYTWLYPADWQVFGPANATAITFQTGALEGEVCVITTLFGCIGDTACTTVALDPPIADPQSIVGERGTCEFVEQTYSIPPISGAQEYIWEVPNGWGLLNGQGTNQITVAVGSNPGQICVQARNGVCLSDQECAYINVGETVGQVTEIFGDREICFDDSTTFEIDNVPGADRYIWTWPATWTLIGGQQTAILNVVGGLTFGQLTVTPANAYCDGQPFSIDIISIDKPEADFSWNLIDDFEATFFDSSKGVPSSFFWDFDDGTTSIEVTPEYTFPEERIYNVTLIASNKCGSDTVTKEVPIYQLSSREGELLSGYTLYPNPAEAHLMLSAEQAFNLEAVAAIDATGRTIPLQFDQENAKAYILDISSLTTGAYLLKIDIGNEIGFTRFVKQ